MRTHIEVITSIRYLEDGVEDEECNGLRDLMLILLLTLLLILLLILLHTCRYLKDGVEDEERKVLGDPVAVVSLRDAADDYSY